MRSLVPSLLLLATLGAGRPAAAAEPVPAIAEPISTAPETGHRRLLDLELRGPLFSNDFGGLCLEGFPARSGWSVGLCGLMQVTFNVAVDVEVMYRLPLHTGSVLTLAAGPGVSSHWIYDTMQGPLIGWSTDGFASLEAVWWSDLVGFELQLDAGAMWIHDRERKDLDAVAPIVNLSAGLAFRTLL